MRSWRSSPSEYSRSVSADITRAEESPRSGSSLPSAWAPAVPPYRLIQAASASALARRCAGMLLRFASTFLLLMRVSVMVLGNPAHSSAERVALRLLELAHADGHALDTLFLYHNGTYAALNPAGPDAGWQRMVRETGLQCVVCRTAWERSGVAGVPPAPFRLGGLADWVAAVERSERVLRLGTLAA